MTAAAVPAANAAAARLQMGPPAQHGPKAALLHDQSRTCTRIRTPENQAAAQLLNQLLCAAFGLSHKKARLQLQLLRQVVC